jgi:predicted permease
MLHDLKHAYRMLLQTKGWTLVVLLSLAIGIGATTALFTAVNGMLLQSVPVPAPDRLVRLAAAGDNDMRRSSSDYGFSEPYEGKNVRASFSFAVHDALRGANQTLTGLAAFAPLGQFNVIVNGAADMASGYGVSGNFFEVVRVPMAHGRALTPDDDRPGAPPAAVVSHAYWQRRLGADPAAVGQSVRINNTPMTIVGVTAAHYTGIQRLGGPAPDVTVTLAMHPQVNPVQAERMQQATTWWLLAIGRLKPGVTPAQVVGNLEGPFHAAARAGMDAYMAGLTTEQRGLSDNQRRGTAVPALVVRSAAHGMYDVDRGSARSATIVSVVVTILLLIVCANVANLLLSRASTRHREISVRLSMGARRSRLVRQLLTESLVLSGTGGVLGIGVAYWSKSLLPFGQNATIDARVVAFVVGVSVLTGLLFGLMPALRATEVDLSSAMKEASRSVTGSRSWLSKSLLILQVAMSLVLLVGAGLFLRTLHNLRGVDVGFNANNLLMFRINPQANGYQPERVTQLYARTEAALAALPGIASVAMTRMPLLSGSTSTSDVWIHGGSGPNEMYMMWVSPEFFETLEIPLLAGRLLARHDVGTPKSAAVINETAAKKYFAGSNPLGQRLGQSPETAGEAEVVGVIRDTKYNTLREPAPPTLYQLYQALPPTAGSALTVVVRTAGDPSVMIEPVRAAMRQVDPEVPVVGMTTQTDQIEGRVAQERLFALAYSMFGGVALLLACIGLFGLMSYTVSRRTNEIGIRIALGAQRSGVVGMVLRESMIMVVIGVAIGLVAAVAASRLIATILFGLAANDVWTMTAAIALMAAVSLIAGYLPARTASRVDPMVALRYE